MLASKPDALRRQGGLVFASLAAYSALVFYGWYFAASMPTLLLMHGVISVLVMAGGVLLLGRDELSASLPLYGPSIVVLGPVGITGCALMDAVRWATTRSKISREEWYERLFPPTLTDRTKALYEMIEWRGAKPRRESTVAPFSQVLEHGSVAQKQAVVTLIADHFTPEFAPALQRALNDPEPAIRVQAATAAARIENAFLRRSVELQEEHTKDSGNQAVAQAIALHHEAYARTGLLDLERASREKRLALEIHAKHLRASPNDPVLTAAVARLLLELGRTQEAICLLRPWLRAPSIPHALVAPIGEALFSLKRLWLLRRLSTRLLASLTTEGADAPLRDFLTLWTPSRG